MKGVQRQFRALKIVELVLIAGGGVAAVVGARSDRKRLLGAGLALSLEAAMTLSFDMVAARRASGYTGQLSALQVGVAVPAPGQKPTVVLMHTRPF